MSSGRPDTLVEGWASGELEHADGVSVAGVVVIDPGVGCSGAGEQTLF